MSGCELHRATGGLGGGGGVQFALLIAPYGAAGQDRSTSTEQGAWRTILAALEPSR